MQDAISRAVQSPHLGSPAGADLRRVFVRAFPYTHETAAPPEALKPDIPHHLSDLVMQLLSKQPDERVGSAKELAEKL